MKKTTIALAVAIASLTTAAAHAAPMEETWYLGGKVGWSSFHGTAFDNSVVNQPSNSNTTKDRVGFGGFVGYQATNYLAFELGYDYLGKIDYKTTSTNSNSGDYKVHGAQFVAKLSYPIMEDLDIYTRLGGFMWNGKSKVNGTSAYGSDTGISPLAAIGLEYAITKNIATRLDYQWVSKIGENDTVGTRPDNMLLALGVSYRFGQEPVAKAKPVELAVKTNRFVLNDEVLFAFGKAELKEEGNKTLDKLYSELVAREPTEGSIIVIGHTDRLGPNRVNQPLSEKRAHNVMEYLVAKGIPAASISAKGVGSSASVTGETCKTMKGADLKACLAPDRRVEIEVKGAHETVEPMQSISVSEK